MLLISAIILYTTVVIHYSSNTLVIVGTKTGGGSFRTRYVTIGNFYVLLSPVLLLKMCSDGCLLSRNLALEAEKYRV